MQMRTEPQATWRSELPVLVTEAQAMGSIAVIRSLGRAGYPVHACATRTDALGLQSRFAARAEACPDVPGAFIGWLREYISKHNICTIIPSEKVLIYLRPV